MTLTPFALDEIVNAATSLIAAVRHDTEASVFTDMAADMLETVLAKFGLIRQPAMVAVAVAVESRNDEVEF